MAVYDHTDARSEMTHMERSIETRIHCSTVPLSIGGTAISSVCLHLWRRAKLLRIVRQHISPAYLCANACAT